MCRFKAEEKLFAVNRHSSQESCTSDRCSRFTRSFLVFLVFCVLVSPLDCATPRVAIDPRELKFEKRMSPRTIRAARVSCSTCHDRNSHRGEARDRAAIVSFFFIFFFFCLARQRHELHELAATHERETITTDENDFERRKDTTIVIPSRSLRV